MSTLSDSHTATFMREFETASRIQKEAHKRGTTLTIREAHSVWAEYSDRMCAGWMAFDSENPVAEIWREITLWKTQRKRK